LNIARDDPRMASYFREMLESGASRPLVDRQYPLDEIVEAYRYVETGRKIGNVVINVEPSASPRRVTDRAPPLRPAAPYACAQPPTPQPLDLARCADESDTGTGMARGKHCRS
jgi:hypothetical protein